MARLEIWQALGDFYLFQRRNDEAKVAHERALAGYKASIEQGETLYIHHLAGFYCDSGRMRKKRSNTHDAISRRRQSGYAWDSLAWALCKAGDSAGALEAARKAIATGLADPHVLQHAGMIFLSAGEVPEGQRLLKHCAEVNPHFAGFRVSPVNHNVFRHLPLLVISLLRIIVVAILCLSTARLIR